MGACWTTVAVVASCALFICWLTHKPCGSGRRLSWPEARILRFVGVSDFVFGRAVLRRFNEGLSWRHRFSVPGFYGAMRDLQERGLVEREETSDADGLQFSYRITPLGVICLRVFMEAQP